jgi:hypothetical protein
MHRSKHPCANTLCCHSPLPPCCAAAGGSRLLPLAGAAPAPVQPQAGGAAAPAGRLQAPHAQQQAAARSTAQPARNMDAAWSDIRTRTGLRGSMTRCPHKHSAPNTAAGSGLQHSAQEQNRTERQHGEMHTQAQCLMHASTPQHSAAYMTQKCVAAAAAQCKHVAASTQHSKQAHSRQGHPSQSKHHLPALYLVNHTEASDATEAT